MSTWMILRDPAASIEDPSARSSVPISALSPDRWAGQGAVRDTLCRRIGGVGRRHRLTSPAGRGKSNGDWHAFRWRDVLHRLFDVGDGACPRARGARFRVGLGTRALAYPLVAQDAIPGRGRPAQTVLRRNGPLRSAGAASQVT